MASKLDAALAYAARGWAVLPLRGKLPAIAKAGGGRGVHDATTAEERIRVWWQRWPQATIGLACGEPSGLWVLDTQKVIRFSEDEIYRCLDNLKMPRSIQRAAIVARVHRFFTRPEEFRRAAPLETPPGAPIGCACGTPR